MFGPSILLLLLFVERNFATFNLAQSPLPTLAKQQQEQQKQAEHANRAHKQIVHIGLVYQNYARSKVYDKAFKESIRNINSGQSITALRKLPAKFTLAPVDCVLPRGRFFPSHVLNCLCGVMVANKVALIVFVTASEGFDESTAAAQYFLHMASQTDIPIVAWNADNAGFTFSKPMSRFRILQLAPPIQHQVRAMLALLKRYQWARFGVVTSKMAGSQEFLKIVQEEIQAQEDRSFKSN